MEKNTNIDESNENKQDKPEIPIEEEKQTSEETKSEESKTEIDIITMKKIEKCAQQIAKASRVIVFTGAGMSAESGIETFRGSSGLWSGITGSIGLALFGTPIGWNWTSRLAWNLFIKYFYNPIKDAKPNKGHEALADLGKMMDVHVITQNVDGLHQDAGSDPTKVYEVHGTVRKFRCINKGHPYHFDTVELPTSSPRCKVEGCNSYLRPDCTLFTEALPEEAFTKAMESIQDLGEEDVMIIVGTSATVYPAASIPEYAAQRRMNLIEVNLEPTSFAQLPKCTFLRGGAAKILPILVEKVKQIRGK